jgi:long-subunit fatty acid transport protein
VKRLIGCAGLCLLAVVAATPTAAQFPLPLPGQAPALDPQELQQPRRVPFTLTPSITITEEFNDNIFLDNDRREWDFITGFTPGLALTFEDATRRLSLAYSFTAELFARESEESHAFDRQSFVGDALWRVNPQLTLTLADTFAFSTDTNLVATETVSTGRDRAWSNTLAGGAAWQFDRLTALRGGLGWTVERFDSSEAQDSDVYRADVSLDRRLTPRLTGSAGYQFAYFDIEREARTTVHTPRVGVAWEATPTITLSLTGGPSTEIKEDSSTRVTPAVTAGYRQRLGFGAWGLTYDRAIGTAGGLGGTTDNQLIAAFLDVTTLARGLTVQVSPRYSIVESPRDDSIDVRSFTLGVQATYRITPVVALVAGYQFFHQRSDSTILTSAGTPLAADADQNRVFVGIQFGYPIRFD